MREILHDFCIREGRQDLLDQWVEDINLPITSTGISRGSKRKVWRLCEKGHDCQAAAGTRTIVGSGCPVCAGRTSQKRLARYQAALAEVKEVMQI